MKRIFLAFVGVLATLFASAAAADTKFLQSLNDPAYHLVKSETLERPFHIFVRLPDGYGETDKNYPTVYLLDGGTTFPLLASYYVLMAIDEPLPDAIIVGISYGGATFEDGNYRSTDYTAPAPDRDYWGGASDYQDFLADELFPLIESTYRSDEARRIVYGQSLGGQFVLHAAQTKPDLFWGYIASNPALHRNLSLFVEDFIPSGTTDSKLFVSSGTKDAERFRVPALAWIDFWTKRANKPWRLKVVHLQDETHAAAAPNAFRAGMQWLFENEISDAE